MSSQAIETQASESIQWAPSLGAARARFGESLQRSHELLRCIGVPAPLARADALLTSFAKDASFLWDAPGGEVLVGIGVAGEVRSRVGQSLRDDVDAFLANRHYDAPHNAPALRLVGGLAFARGSADHAPWSAFGDGVFVLPRWMYIRQNQAAWLVFSEAEHASGASADHDEIIAELEAIWQSLLWEEKRSSNIPRTLCTTHTPEHDWSSEVLAIRHAIERGEVQKVVAARESEVQLSAPCDPMDLLGALDERFAGCTRFAMWREASVFLGATPESLVAKHGKRVASEALAGSVPIGQAESMLKSVKERAEHQYVVDAIVDVLKPWCRILKLGSTPEVRELPDLLHLQTPIEGELSQDKHVLDLVDALHPTPAVGGVPKDRALAWIIEHESAARGWYSAPFGWVDTQGDGEFVVALRSGLIQGSRAWIYAGAGVVRDSEPPAEYRETELKMQALLGAFSPR